MPHEVLSEKIDSNDLNFVLEYIEQNFLCNEIRIPAWVLSKLIQYLRLSFRLDLVFELTPRMRMEHVSNEDKENAEAYIRLQLAQARILENSLRNFSLIKQKLENGPYWTNYSKFMDRLSQKRRNGQGFSFVRLGDGEGNAIALVDSFMDSGVRDWSRKIFDLQFGQESPIDYLSQRRIGDGVRNSAINADILGIIQPKTVASKIEQRAWPADRQLQGNLHCLEFFTESVTSLNPDVKIIDSSVHKDSNFIEMLFKFFAGEKVVTFIGPHPEVVRHAESFNFKVINFIKTPGEWKYFKPKVHHLHESYEWIAESIRPSYPGAPFFVGAGLLGKHYCDIVKKRGGIALDIGSAMDDIAGFSKTRS